MVSYFLPETETIYCNDFDFGCNLNQTNNQQKWFIAIPIILFPSMIKNHGQQKQN